VNGAKDRIAPPILGETYTAKVQVSGDSGETVIIDGEGHVELIAPRTKSFERQTAILQDMLGLK